MEVVGVADHSNADSLKVYTMRYGSVDTQIVANLENVYDVGDSVAVVLDGSVLKDGTKINASKIRGIISQGMALGKSDQPVGTDVSSEYCKPMDGNGFRLLKWASIESLFNIRKAMKRTGTERSVNYRFKVKLDGTNGGVQISKDGKVQAQSRGQLITPKQDNHGFARWVEANHDYFAGLARDKHLTVYGEWCGKGIQGGTAIASIDRRIFVVFAIQYGGMDGEMEMLDINPFSISQALTQDNRIFTGLPEDVYVLPFFGTTTEVNYTNKNELEKTVNQLNEMVSGIEKCDPWVKYTFRADGIGEGLVAYPLPDGKIDYNCPILINSFDYSELVFKAKGEKHKTVKTKKAVQIDPEVAKSIDEFVALFLTDARLNQWADSEYDVKKTGQFIKDISIDVKKESEAELEASGLTWKQVAKEVSNKAREWYIAKTKEL